MNPLLYGHATDEFLVATHLKDDNTIRLYFREADVIRAEDVPFYPFFFLSDRKHLEGFNRKHWVKQLSGSAYYQYLCVFEEWPVMWEAVRYIQERYNQSALTKVTGYSQLDILHLYTDPATQYLLQTGRTLFKGMTFMNLHRLQLDIETYSSSAYNFSNASRPADRIILIALSDNRGWEHLIDGRKLTEKEMLKELVRIIREKDPDVIEGHNILGFDLPYILKRCSMNNVQLGLGRDGSIPRSFEGRMSFAERSFDYTGSEIAGRHVVDTLMLVQSYDMIKRNMESYGLKYAAKYFGLATEQRTYIAGNRITWHWDNDPEPLIAYAMDDVRETRGLSELLSGSAFYLTQMLPFNYAAVVRMGAAGKIESLLVREYLRIKHSIPKPQSGFQTTGGYTDIFVSGVVGPVIHADVESLYPSLMISKEVKPASDNLGIFPSLLQNLTLQRLEAKRAMTRSANTAEYNLLDALQSSFKILINSFYGYLGYRKGLFNDYAQADVVTKAGQELLRRMMQEIRNKGGTVIEVDTDGIFFIPPEGTTDEDQERMFVEQLSSAMPEGISVALDGRYRKMLSYKMKNYALLGYDEKLIIKGSSLVSRSMERFGRLYVKKCIDCILRDDIDALHAIYTEFYQSITRHTLDIRDLAKTESLSESVQEYIEAVESGKRNKSAAYEVAISTGKQVKPGSRVSFYVTGNEANVRSFEFCKSVDEWNPNFPDENVAYYLRRLDEFSEKFIDFFRTQDFRSIFSIDDLFPFNSKGVSVVTKTTISDGTPGKIGLEVEDPSDSW